MYKLRFSDATRKALEANRRDDPIPMSYYLGKFSDLSAARVYATAAYVIEDDHVEIIDTSTGLVVDSTANMEFESDPEQE